MIASAETVVVVDKKKAAVDIEYAKSVYANPGFVAYDERFQQVLGATPQIKLVEERPEGDQFAHEAGVYNKATDSVYFTANFQTSDPIELYSVNCKTHKVEKLDYNIPQANGACQYKDGILYCAQGDKTTVSALIHVDPVTKKETTVINNFQGRPFSSVNDVVIHHETGDIWFTDPLYGYMQGFRPPPDLPIQVYRFSPDTGDIWVVADRFHQCNGLCFSPDYTKLYVTDTGGVQSHKGVGDGHQMFLDPVYPATIYVYDVIDKKTLGSKRTFAYSDSGVPDGIKCDAYGNVYSGCGNGVHVWAPDGTLIGKIVVGSVVANFCFVRGGIWMFAEQGLYFCTLGAKGALVSIECE
ncbi:calcium-dependent phosphotriesterase-1 [Dipodascopsis uninucleata]